jgi:hypothetical protein
VLAANARDLGLKAWSFLDVPSQAEAEAGKQSSNWVLLARTPEDAAAVTKDDGEWTELEPNPGFRTWTDDFSNVLDVFKGES